MRAQKIVKLIKILNEGIAAPFLADPPKAIVALDDHAGLDYRIFTGCPAGLAYRVFPANLAGLAYRADLATGDLGYLRDIAYSEIAEIGCLARNLLKVLAESADLAARSRT